jgi:uncharacterized protein DUF4412
MRSIVTAVSGTAAMCVAAAALLHAASGVLVVEKTTSGGSTQTNQVQIENTRMRAESSGARGRKQVVVFDSTRQILRLIDPEKKTYTEMTKEDMDRFGGQVSAAMEQVKKQMESMPPEKRAQFEAMMKGRGMAAVPAKPQYKRVGTDTVGKWTCDKYEGYVDGKKTSEICTVEPKVLGFTASDFDVSRKLVEFFRKMVPQIADQTFTIGRLEEQGFSGIPVRRVFTAAGEPVTTEIVDIKRQSFADAVFAVPEGFQKQEFMGAGRGR